MGSWRRYSDLLVAVLVLACGDDGGPRVVADLAFVLDPFVITVGTTRQLGVRVLDGRGRRIDGVRVEYEAVDSTVARVNASGVVTGVVIGYTAIRATIGPLSKVVGVAVTPPVGGIVVEPSSVTLNIGAYTYLLAYGVDPAGAIISGYTLPIRFSSSDSTVARAGIESGAVTAMGGGSATIRVTMDTFTVNVPLTVGIVPTTIGTTPVTQVLAVGDSFPILATLLDGVGNPIAGANFSYSSDAPGLLSVSAGGRVKSVGGTGSGTVTVTSGAIRARVGVLVGAIGPAPTVTTVNLQLAPYAAAFRGTLLVSQAGGYSAAVGDMSVPNGLEEVILGGAPLGVAINHAGTRGYVAHSNGVSVIDLGSHAVVDEFPSPHSGNNYDVEVSLDDQRIFLGNEYGVYALNAATGVASGPFNTFGAFSLAHHPTLARLYVVETGTGDILELNANTMTLLRRLRPPVQAGPKEIAISPDGSELYLAAQGDRVAGQLQVWDLAAGELVQQVPLPEAFGVVATGPYLLVAASQADVIRIYDRLSRVLLHSVPAGMPRRPAASANGLCFYVPSENGFMLNICM